MNLQSSVGVLKDSLTGPLSVYNNRGSQTVAALTTLGDLLLSREMQYVAMVTLLSLRFRFHWSMDDLIVL